MTEEKPKPHTVTVNPNTQVVHTEAGDLHITQHPAKKGKKPKITVLLETDDLVRDQARGFVNFLREHAVVGLAVGFIIGQQAQGLIKQLVDSFITPMLSVWFGENLANKKFTVGGMHAVDFTWGKFIYSFINFIFVLLFIYVIIKLFKLDKLDKPKQ
jgi:large-conductance mechanosensitive channel